jgi:hypothetical protein
MLKMDLSFEDLSGEQVTETHYFHLSKADLVEMEVSHKGGLQKYFQSIVASEDGKAIIDSFREIILKSYGVKSDDGRRFIKNEQLRQEFLSSEAYSTLFMQLCTDADAAAAFVTGIIPSDLNTDQLKLDTPVDDGEPVAPMQTEGRNVFESATPPSVEPRELTKAELVEMDDAELRSGLAEGRYKLS